MTGWSVVLTPMLLICLRPIQIITLFLVFLTTRYSDNGRKPFRLEKYWMDHPEFRNIICQSWVTDDITCAVPTFRDVVLSWSNHVFGNIFQTKKRLLARLAGIQKSLNYATSFFLRDLECKLKTDFNDILTKG